MVPGSARQARTTDARTGQQTAPRKNAHTAIGVDIVRAKSRRRVSNTFSPIKIELSLRGIPPLKPRLHRYILVMLLPES